MALTAVVVVAGCAGSGSSDGVDHFDAPTSVTVPGGSAERAPRSAQSTVVETTSPTSSTVVDIDSPWRLPELLEWLQPPQQPLDAVYLVDLRRAARQLGIRPDCANDDATSEYLVETYEGTNHFPYAWRDAREGAVAYEVEFGLSLCDVAAAADARSPRAPYAWLVESPPTQIVSALESDPSWSMELEPVPHDDYDVFRWGDSPIGDLSRVSAARPGGYGGQVVVANDVFVRSNNERELDALLDAQAADTTLDDYESVRELLGYMEATGAHSVLLFRALEVEAPFAVSATVWPSLAELDKAIPTRPKLAPYEFFALVIGASGADDLFTLAVLNTEEIEAVDNTARLQAVMEKGLRIEGGPDARWVDLVGGEVLSYGTLGRLSVATFGAERNNNGVSRLVNAIYRDVIRWYDDGE